MLSLDHIRALRGILQSDSVTIKGSQALQLFALIAALNDEEQVLLSQQAAHAGLQNRIRAVERKPPEELPAPGG